MPDPPGLRSLARSADLVAASVYERVVESGIASVWENVFDWEHLPWLHKESFDSIECRSSGEWGWHADVGFPGGAVAEIELIADRDARYYVSRSLSGAGAPGEIWTTLEPLAETRTSIRVEFLVTPRPADVLEKIGAAYRALYERLWDQDAEMMRIRDRVPQTSQASEGRTADGVDLGRWETLEPRLPMVVEFSGHEFRIVAKAGRIWVHSTECPHWRGPLGDCAIEDGILTCPWHGYRFDLETGRSVEGRSIRLRPAPTVERDPESGSLRLVAPRREEKEDRM